MVLPCNLHHRSRDEDRRLGIYRDIVSSLTMQEPFTSKFIWRVIDFSRGQRFRRPSSYATSIHRKMRNIRYFGRSRMASFCSELRQAESYTYDISFPDRLHWFSSPPHPWVQRRVFGSQSPKPWNASTCERSTRLSANWTHITIPDCPTHSMT
jgi:hypothetical protein